MPQGAEPKSSGTVHNAMRYRAAIEHDPAVIEAMARKAALVDEAVAALRPGHRERLGSIMDRDIDLRRSVYDLPAAQDSVEHLHVTSDVFGKQSRPVLLFGCRNE